MYVACHKIHLIEGRHTRPRIFRPLLSNEFESGENTREKELCAKDGISTFKYLFLCTDSIKIGLTLSLECVSILNLRFVSIVQNTNLVLDFQQSMVLIGTLV
jgi:hypothetical protein